MASYHIRDFEALTGVKAHTIRIWEQRYGLLKPTRTDTNIRLYNDDELTLLLNISLLNRNGFKISKVAKMDRTEIEEKVRHITSTKMEHANQIDALTLSMLELNELEFGRLINISCAHLGFEQSMEMVVFPFLRNLGILWQTGTINPAQEHFISNLIRQKLIVAIDHIPLAEGETKGRALLFLPEGELHELGLLYLNYLLRKNHYHVMYLGQSVPFRDIEKVIAIFNPDLLFSVFTSYPQAAGISEYIRKVSKLLPKGQIYFSGQLLQSYSAKPPKNVKIVDSLARLRDLINSQPVSATAGN